jgi:hypothetical protein
MDDIELGPKGFEPGIKEGSLTPYLALAFSLTDIEYQGAVTYSIKT